MKHDDILEFQRVTPLEEPWSDLVFRVAPQLLADHDNSLPSAFEAAARAVIELRNRLHSGDFRLDGGDQLQWNPDGGLEILAR